MNELSIGGAPAGRMSHAWLMSVSFDSSYGGGGSGIGEGCALRLAQQGCHVVLVGRNPAKLDGTAARIAEAGGSAEAFPADVRDWDRLGELAALVEASGVDFLINSAGGQFPKQAAELSRNGWKAVVETNLDGSFFLARQLYPALAKRRGSVVMIVANLWQRGAATMAPRVQTSRTASRYSPSSIGVSRAWTTCCRKTKE